MGEYNKKIDGYEIKPIPPEKRSDNKNLTIVFMSGGEVFLSQDYEVEKSKEDKIRNKLFDYTLHNLNEPHISRCIPFFTILHEIEEIIYKKEG